MMKKLLLPLILITILFAEEETQKADNHVGTLHFTGAGYTVDELDAFTRKFQTELFKLNRFQLMEQEQMGALLEEKGLVESGCTLTDCYVQLGKSIGVNKMLTTSVSKIGTVTSFTTKIIDVESGKIIRSTVLDTEKPFDKILKKDIPNLAQKIGGKGKISESVYEFKLDEERNPIAVLEIKGSGISDAEASGLTDRLRAELFNTGKFEVLEREQMVDILQEQGFQQTGMCDDESCLVEVGQLTGVKYMVGGSVTRIGDLYSVSARIIDVGTGKIMRSATTDVKGNIEVVLKGTMQDMSRSLAGLKVERRSNKPAVGFMVGGLSAIAGGAVFTVLGNKDFQKYQDEGLDPDLVSEYRKSSQAKYIASYSLYGAGAAAIGTSVVLFISKRRKLDVHNSIAFNAIEDGVALSFKF
jgi:curli biogenesis system outer membrane secretion channel CsgG